jgi:cytochrome c-type biogenesis protein CcmH
MVLAWLTLVALSVSAPPDRMAIEQEARRIERLLIAPCCRSQPVSDPNSAAADEIRAGIRRLLADGQSRDQVLAHYVARYGERVLAEPPAHGFKASLHVLPWVALGLGAVAVAGLVARSGRRRGAAGEAAVPVAAGAHAPPDRYAERLDEELRRLD